MKRIEQSLRNLPTSPLTDPELSTATGGVERNQGDGRKPDLDELMDTLKTFDWVVTASENGPKSNRDAGTPPGPKSNRDAGTPPG